LLLLPLLERLSLLAAPFTGAAVFAEAATAAPLLPSLLLLLLLRCCHLC
jgi:hypothetical protein